MYNIFIHDQRKLKNKVMDLHSSLLLPLLMLLLVLATLSAATQLPTPPDECQTQSQCDSLTIPFPFATTERCSLDSSFLITCNSSTSPPIPYLRKSNVVVQNISLHGELTVLSGIASDCYSDKGEQINQTDWYLNLLNFSISSSRNKLRVIGCDTIGLLTVIDLEGKNYTTGCVSICYGLDAVANGTCSGAGCCDVSIPAQGLSYMEYASGSIKNHSDVVDFNPCGYAFVVGDGASEFNSTNLVEFRQTKFPVVLEWALGNQTCEEAKKNPSSYACKAENSECYNSKQPLGYLCNCSSGYQGNPYVQDGCQDANECEESKDDCTSEATCQNVPGSYHCLCPEGYEGDGREDGTKCSHKSSSNSKTQIILIIALSVSVSILALLVVSFYVYWGMKKRKLIKLKEQLFQQNGGLLLQQHIARHRGSAETAKVFTMEELKKATDNFAESKVLGQGGQGTVYKGLLDNKTVAIKKSKISDSSQIEQFINEVVVLSQINHRNVVKLMGCCLDTEVPLLVYEFIPNGTISEHIHDHSQSLKLTWKTRLRIAAETAGALAYLHSATSPPVIHRDVKTTNILLDHDLTAKVSDFGASRIVPLDQSQLTTLVQGTLGYLDPEYFHTSQLTEKSDVYSFGVVLAELLTGRKALSFDVPEATRNLALYFVSSMKEGRLHHIVDNNIVDDARAEQLIEVANIAKQCLKVKGEERPTMKEVAMELEGLRVEEKHRWENDKAYSEETENLLGTTIPVYNVQEGASGSGISSGFDSISQIPMSSGGGR